MIFNKNIVYKKYIYSILLIIVSIFIFFNINKVVKAEGEEFVISSDGVLQEYNGTSENVVVPSTVKTIGDYAFVDCITMKTITIPNSVTSLGETIFDGCIYLTEIHFESSSWNCVLTDENKYSDTFSLSNNVNFYIPNIDGKEDFKNWVLDNGYTLYIGNNSPISASVSVDKTQLNVNNKGGTYEIKITSNTNWEVEYENSKLKFSDSNGKGDKILKVKVPKNITEKNITDEFKIKTSLGNMEVVVKVNQSNTSDEEDNNNQNEDENVELDVELDVSISDILIDAKGGINKNPITVNTNNTGGFKVTSNADWLKISTSDNDVDLYKEYSFDNMGKFYIYADANKLTSGKVKDRTATLTITHNKNSKKVQTITVRQYGKKVIAKLDVDTITVIANSNGILSNNSVVVDTNNTGGFYVDTNNSDWFTIAYNNNSADGREVLSFENKGSFYIFVDQNKTGADRFGQINITHSLGNITQTVYVYQSLATSILKLSDDSKIASSEGKIFNNGIEVVTQATGGFTVDVGDCDWVKLSRNPDESFGNGLTSLTGKGDEKFFILVSENESSEKRITDLSIRHSNNDILKNIKITQYGKADDYLYTDIERLEFSQQNNVSEPIKVYAREGQKWTASISEKNIDWIKFSNSPDTKFNNADVSIDNIGTGDFYILINKNEIREDRGEWINISSGEFSYDIYIYQDEADPDLETLVSQISVMATKKTIKVGKTSKIVIDLPDEIYSSDVSYLKYGSSNKKIAKVDKKGYITAIKKGNTTIRIKLGFEFIDDNGKSKKVSKTFKVKIKVDKKKIKA